MLEEKQHLWALGADSDSSPEAHSLPGGGSLPALRILGLAALLMWLFCPSAQAQWPTNYLVFTNTLRVVWDRNPPEEMVTHYNVGLTRGTNFVGRLYTTNNFVYVTNFALFSTLTNGPITFSVSAISSVSGEGPVSILTTNLIRHPWVYNLRFDWWRGP